MTCCLGSGLSVVVALSLVGCASSAEARSSPMVPAAATAPAMSAQAVSPSSSTPVVNDSMLPAATDVPPPKPAPDPKTGEAPRGLPELMITLAGLHIGGGPNDAATKRPFIETLEKGFDAMRICYPAAEEPEKGGTFGVDLRVERAGGRPTVQSVRTAMKGDRFKACLEQAFQKLEFGRPANGPTVLSASVLFALGP